MICPKCGHENPRDELFCEECDFRMDQKYREPADRSSLMVYGTFAAAALGLASIVSVFLEAPVFAVVFGAIGMLLGSYTMTVTRMSGVEGNPKWILLGVEVLAMVTSVYGFIYGLINAI